MVEQRKEATVEPSKTLRMLAATAVVSALAILVASPAGAWYSDVQGNGGPVVAPTASQTVGNPADGAQISPSRIEKQTVTSGGSDGLGTGTFIALAGGAALMLGAGALLFTARHRRVALP